MSGYAGCHDMQRMLSVRRMTEPQFRSVVTRMVKKRKGWIHDSELPLILQHIQKLCAKKPPARK